MVASVPRDLEAVGLKVDAAFVIDGNPRGRAYVRKEEVVAMVGLSLMRDNLLVFGMRKRRRSGMVSEAVGVGCWYSCWV